MTWQWIENGLGRLAAKHNLLYKFLIEDRRLRLAFQDAKLDCIDLHSANFVAASIANRKSLCVLLPDASPRRPAFLFACAILSQWWKSRDALIQKRRCILYCGSHTGIREQLGKVAVSGLSQSLADLFGQVNLARSELLDQAANSSTLPLIVTAYSPANPAALVARLSPVFIALDFGDAPFLPWLDALMAHAKEKGIPVLAWGTNPLSSAFSEIGLRAQVVQWPFGRTFQETCAYERKEQAERIFEPYIVTEIQPLLASSDSASAYADSLVRSAKELVTLTNGNTGPFARRVIQQYWRLYRTLEQLHVPYGIYEAEVSSLWGYESIQKQLATCEHFRTLLHQSDPRSAGILEGIHSYLLEAAEYLEDNPSPIWSALTELVQTDAEIGTARLIIFSSRAKKSLFTLSLLAKLNLTVDDLVGKRNWLLTLNELQSLQGYSDQHSLELDAIPRDLTLAPLLVSLPSPAALGQLWPAFLGETLSVLAHEFQRSTLKYRVRAWHDGLTPNLMRLTSALSDLIPFPYGGEKVSANSRVIITEPISVKNADGSTQIARPGKIDAISDELSLEDELSHLLGHDDDETFSGIDETDNPDLQDNSNPWVDEYFVVVFTDGWVGQFDAKQKLNYISPKTSACDERFIQGLRPGDTILIIPYQRRQSLYGLIISRIHKHPAIALHLSLLRRWKEDLLVGYEHWTRKTFGPRREYLSATVALDQFLNELQQRGSILTSTLAIKFWMSGVTLCPSDPEDIRRVGEILQIKFIEDQHRRIAAAASRIRGLHRGLSMRLNHWLADKAKGGGQSHDSEVIDQETRLTFGDVRDSFVVAKIESIETIREPILRSLLGTINKGAGYDQRERRSP